MISSGAATLIVGEFDGSLGDGVCLLSAICVGFAIANVSGGFTTGDLFVVLISSGGFVTDTDSVLFIFGLGLFDDAVDVCLSGAMILLGLFSVCTGCVVRLGTTGFLIVSIDLVGVSMLVGVVFVSSGFCTD